MYDKTDDPSGLRTAFRDAEKQYQLQLRQSIRLRFGSGRSGQVSCLVSATRCINHVHLTHQVRIKHREHLRVPPAGRAESSMESCMLFQQI